MRSSFCVFVFAWAVLFAALGDGQAATLPVTAGLELQLDPSVFGSLTLSGNQVTAWADQSPNAYSAVIPGASTPTYQPAGITLDTGATMPDLRFYNGDSMELTNAAAGDVGLGESVSVFVVVHSLVSPGDGMFLLNKITAAGGGNGWRLNTHSSGVRLMVDGPGGNAQAKIVPPTWSNKIYSGVYDRAAAETEIYTDGTSIGTVTGLPNPGDSSSGSMLVIAANPDSGAFTTGNFGEILIYDRALSGTEMAQVNQYLVDKWITGVPEPSTLVLLIAGFLGVCIWKPRRVR